MTLNWSAPLDDGGLDIENYYVYQRTDSNSGNGPEAADMVAMFDGEVFSYTATGLDRYSTYYYWVSAVNSMGEMISPGVAQRTRGTVPSVPLNLTFSDVFADQFSLAWDVPADDGGPEISGYDLFICPVDSIRAGDIICADRQQPRNRYVSTEAN